MVYMQGEVLLGRWASSCHGFLSWQAAMLTPHSFLGWEHWKGYTGVCGLRFFLTVWKRALCRIGQTSPTPSLLCFQDRRRKVEKKISQRLKKAEHEWLCRDQWEKHHKKLNSLSRVRSCIQERQMYSGIRQSLLNVCARQCTKNTLGQTSVTG